MIENVEVLKNENGEMEIKIVNADDGLGEVLVRNLNEDKSVKFTAYKREHPTNKYIKLIIKSKDPKKSLLKAIEGVKKEINELGEQIKKN